jgi:hypothetical protein
VPTDRPRWVEHGEYSVNFYITGSNFDAISYTARYQIEIREDGHHRSELTFRWLLAPRRLKVPQSPPIEQPAIVHGWDAEPFPAHLPGQPEKCPNPECRVSRFVGRAVNWPWQTECWNCGTYLWS